jgi:CRP-like cAMP-binding protein
MYVKQADFFWGTSMIFVNTVMRNANRIRLKAGDFVFQESDPADFFYVLLKGRIKLSVGDPGQMVYLINQPGEAFGWSSLINRKLFSATAQCKTASEVIALDRIILQNILDKDPVNAAHFYKGLATTMAERLLQSYKVITSISKADETLSRGSGQFQTTDAFD